MKNVIICFCFLLLSDVYHAQLAFTSPSNAIPASTAGVSGYQLTEKICQSESMDHCINVTSGGTTHSIISFTGNVGQIILSSAENCFEYIAPFGFTGEDLITFTVENDLSESATVSIGIVVVNPYTPIDAGPEIALCQTNTTTISAINPDPLATGYWTVLSGTGVIANPNLPTTTVSNLSLGNNVLVWHQEYPCDQNLDPLTIHSYWGVLPAADASTCIEGNSIYLCNQNYVTLCANNPENSGTGTWEILSGAGVIANVHNPNASVDFLAPGTNTFRWTLSNGSCDGETTSDLVYVYVGTGDCIFGCTDVLACNFDSSATSSDGTCDYSCQGCTNPTACNYDVNATTDNGLCYYLSVNAGPDLTTCLGGVVELSGWATPFMPGNTYIWTPGVALAGSTTPTPLASPSSTTLYTLIVITPDGCTASDDVVVTVGAACIFGCTEPFASNYNPDATFDDGTCAYSSCTDSTAINYDPLSVFQEECLYTTLIFVYHDLNNDGIRQSNEPGLSNWPVNMASGDITVYTDNEGFISLDLQSYNYNFSIVNEIANWESTTPSVITLSVPQSVYGEFGMNTISGNTQIVSAQYEGFWDIIHCTNGMEAGIHIENTGSENLNGILTLYCDSVFLPEAAAFLTVAPDSTSAGFAQWTLTNYLPGEMDLFALHIDGPGVDFINEIFNFHFVLTLVDSNQIEIYNEDWTVSSVVACAYDPNDMLATPVGYAEPHYILAGDRIQYKIRFQNIGNLPAENVVVTNLIDTALFDLESFVPHYGSDLVSTSLNNDGEINFVFEDINLQAAQEDEEGSHGFMVYSIQTKADLVPGTVLYNEADIFFDENPAIHTNLVFHTIFDCAGLGSIDGNLFVCENDSISLYTDQTDVENYEWNVDGELSSDSSAYTSMTLTPGVHIISLTVGNPICSNTLSAVAEVLPNPILDAGEYAPVCIGEFVLLQATSNGIIEWDNGLENGSSYAPDSTVVLGVTATSVDGCIAYDQAEIVVGSLPDITISWISGVLHGPEGTAWQWYENGNAVEGATDQLYSPSSEGEYYVITTNEFGCSVQSESLFIGGTPENDLTGSRIFPNPLTSSALVILPNGIFDVSLYDSAGRLVNYYGKQQNQFVLERKSLESGLFQLVIQNEYRKIHLTVLLD